MSKVNKVIIDAASKSINNNKLQYPNQWVSISQYINL